MNRNAERVLRGYCVKVPRELYTNLMLLHSYILVKHLLPMGDHATAARM